MRLESKYLLCNSLVQRPQPPSLCGRVRLLYVASVVAIVTLLIVLVAMDTPENLISLAGLAGFIIVCWITSVNPARVSLVSSCLYRGCVEGVVLPQGGGRCMTPSSVLSLGCAVSQGSVCPGLSLGCVTVSQSSVYMWGGSGRVV